MKHPAWLPSIPEVSRETITVLLGAVAAAAIISQLPGVKAWMQRAWSPAADNGTTPSTNIPGAS